jgi:rhodanese-related sulfurtransferase
VSIREITVQELKIALETGARVIDVREAIEFEEGHVPSAQFVPLSTVANSLDVFRSNTDVYVICQAGARSMRACEFLHDQGITNVVNVIGGTSGWIAVGYSVNSGTNS